MYRPVRTVASHTSPTAYRGTTVALATGKRIPWVWDLTADFESPAHTFTSYTLEAHGESTLLPFRDTPFGRLGEGAITSMEDGWKQLLEGALKAYCEGR